MASGERRYPLYFVYILCLVCHRNDHRSDGSFEALDVVFAEEAIDGDVYL